MTNKINAGKRRRGGALSVSIRRELKKMLTDFGLITRLNGKERMKDLHDQKSCDIAI